MKALAILAMPVAVVVAVIAVTWLLNRAEQARANRKARARHETFLADLHKQAIAHSGANVLADYFADEIRTHLTSSQEEASQ